jgi:transposase
MLFNLCDSQTFQVFLDPLAQENPPVAGCRAILVLDNASRHKVKRLNWHHFQPEYLPPRSPDLNAIERLWLRIKADWFNGWIAKTAANSKTASLRPCKPSSISSPLSNPNAAPRRVYDWSL